MQQIVTDMVEGPRHGWEAGPNCRRVMPDIHPEGNLAGRAKEGGVRAAVPSLAVPVGGAWKGDGRGGRYGE